MADVSRGTPLAVHVGVDIGQQRDPTAVAVCEVIRLDDTIHYNGRHCERLPLGTLYPDVVRRLQAIDDKLRERNAPSVYWWVDATGVGQPVLDMMIEAGFYSLTGVCLTAGDRETWEGGILRIGKALLVSRLQVLLQHERIHLADTPESRALVSELLNYEIRISDDGHDSYGAFRTGTHDDLATALGLAVYKEPAEPRIRWL